MQFSVGQVVVHPHHGPATVVGFGDRRARGGTQRYVDLAVERTNLKISFPLEKTDAIGIRPLLGSAGMRRLLGVLQAKSAPWDRQWSRRMKANQQRLRRGDLLETASVVRDLARRDHAGQLSPAESDMLRQARGPILGELVESLEITDEAAESLFAAAINGEDLPILEELALAS